MTRNEMESKTFSRQELYDLVWSEPMSRLAKKYEISDVGLKKICLRMNIPVPQHGHWQRVQSGKKLKSFVLPANYDGENQVTLQLRGENEPSKPSGKFIVAELQKELEKIIPSLLQVPARLSSPDKLIEAAKKSFEGDNTRYSRYIGVIHLRGLDIRVAKELMPRALRFMDTLIKALHARGHKVEIDNDNTQVVINGEEIRIYFREKLKRVMVKHGSWESSELQGNGILFFWMKRNYEGKEWRDGTRPIEEQLSNIIASLEIEGARLKKQREEREVYWAKMREEERIIREARERKEKEEQDFKDLLHQAARWREANLLHDYLSHLERQAIASSTLTDELKNHITWARQIAIAYDQLFKKGIDPIDITTEGDNDINEAW